MTARILIAVVALLTVPVAAFAACSGEDADKQAMSCLPGTAWDAQTGTCLPLASS